MKSPLNKISLKEAQAMSATHGRWLGASAEDKDFEPNLLYLFGYQLGYYTMFTPCGIGKKWIGDSITLAASTGHILVLCILFTTK